MAIQVKPYTRLSAGGSLVFESFLEYDDADYQAINDDGDPDDFRVVRWYGTNYHSKPLIVTLRKGNGQDWKKVTIPAAESFSVNAGGGVKYESDVPQNFFEWGD